MKRRANIVLLLVAAAFGAACVFRAWWPHSSWSMLLFYMTEAGLVGGLADWFAVTALFRRPLGLPIKHAAIIPNNRRKLIDGAVLMVETQLLPPRVIQEHIARYSFVRSAVLRLDPMMKDGTLFRMAWKTVQSGFARMNRLEVAGRLDKLLRTGLRSVQASRVAGKALLTLLDSGLSDKAFDKLIAELAAKADSSEVKTTIRSMLEAEKERKLNEGGWLSRLFKQTAVQFAESADILNLDEAAEIIHRDLLVFLKDLHREDHEVRLFLMNMLRKLAENLERNPNASRAIEEWKEATLERIELTKPLENMLGHIARSLAEGEADRTKQWIEQLFLQYWDVFRNDLGMQDVLEKHVKEFLNVVVKREHRVIGKVVRETLESFTEERLNAFVESKVGRDLSRIRINGSVLGAMIGACLYVLLHGVYDPILRAIGVS